MTIQKTLRDSAGMRWTALLLLALAMFCSYIFMDILSPIKDMMQETRGWDSTTFGPFFLFLQASFSTRWASASPPFSQLLSCSSAPSSNGTLSVKPSWAVDSRHGSTVISTGLRCSDRNGSTSCPLLMACPHRPSLRPAAS